jgi:hypothetical protein
VNYEFWALLIATSLYAFVAGGAPERLGAAGYLVSCTASFILLSLAPVTRFQSMEVGVFVVDVVTFIAFTILALRAHRLWTMWVSSLLGLGVLGHLARWLGPDVIPWAYAVILSVWSYPILAIIVFGTWNHRRRLALLGHDPSWSTLPGSSVTPGRASPTADTGSPAPR